MLDIVGKALARRSGLADDARCTLVASTDNMDFVYESVATLVDDVKRAQRVAEAYHRKHGWPVE